MGVCGEGEVVGELALLFGETRSSTATVLEPTRCWSLKHNRFRSLAAAADVRSLSRRAVLLMGLPALGLLSRRQLYLLARGMRHKRLKAGDLWSLRGGDWDECFLVEAGDLYVRGLAPQDALKKLFPDGADTVVVDSEADALILRPGTLLGAAAIARVADGAEAGSCPVDVAAGPGGCRGHAFGLAIFAKHLKKVRAGGSSKTYRRPSSRNLVRWF